MNIIEFWHHLLGKTENRKEAHEIKDRFTSEMLNIQKEARQVSRETAKINARLESTAQKIYRATQGEKNAYSN